MTNPLDAPEPPTDNFRLLGEACGIIGIGFFLLSAIENAGMMPFFEQIISMLLP